jgi:aldehyde dehydrogenase (NAD+)
VPVGDPLDPSVLMGPVVTGAARDRILGVIARAADAGDGVLLTGGRRLDADLGPELAGGYFVAPTVFGDVRGGSDLARREIFGPVLSVMRFRDEDEVVALANDSRYGLAAYVHTRDAGRALRVARALEAGTVTINAFPSMSPTAPFGGVKASGYGREGGRAGIDEFLRPKNVTLGA